MAIPKNPATIAINQWLTNNYFDDFIKDNLPNYDVVKTSQYRTPAQNIKAGGVEDSAHQYGLAIDFMILEKGPVEKFVGKETQSKLFNDFILPAWEGYALDEKTHIHVNLDRSISKYTMWMGLGTLAAGSAFAISKVKQYIKNKRGDHGHN